MLVVGGGGRSTPSSNHYSKSGVRACKSSVPKRMRLFSGWTCLLSAVQASKPAAVCPSTTVCTVIQSHSILAAGTSGTAFVPPLQPELVCHPFELNHLLLNQSTYKIREPMPSLLSRWGTIRRQPIQALDKLP